MILVQPTVEKYIPGDTLSGMYESIEYAARICTATQNKMSNDSKKFVEDLANRKHGRALEFGTVYLKVSIMTHEGLLMYNFYRDNYYSKTNVITNDAYITTNYRVIYENNRQDDLKYWSEPTTYHEKRYYLHWKISRVTADSFRTHTMLSSLMQSTRYCNYSIDKFGNNVRIARPDWLKNDAIKNDFEYKLTDFIELPITRCEFIYLSTLGIAEKSYISLVDKNEEEHLQAQLARGILPLDTLTEFIQCGYKEDWDNFFAQRKDNSTGPAHPDAQYIANIASSIIYE